LLTSVRGLITQVPRLLQYGGFNKGTLYGETRIIEEWGVVLAGNRYN
jgi:hypothetical protein